MEEGEGAISNEPRTRQREGTEGTCYLQSMQKHMSHMLHIELTLYRGRLKYWYVVW